MSNKQPQSPPGPNGIDSLRQMLEQERERLVISINEREANNEKQVRRAKTLAKWRLPFMGISAVVLVLIIGSPAITLWTNFRSQDIALDATQTAIPALATQTAQALAITETARSFTATPTPTLPPSATPTSTVTLTPSATPTLTPTATPAYLCKIDVVGGTGVPVVDAFRSQNLVGYVNRGDVIEVYEYKPEDKGWYRIIKRDAGGQQQISGWLTGQFIQFTDSCRK